MRWLLLAVIWGGMALFVAPAGSFSASLDVQRIGDLLGTHATLTPDGVVRAGWARNDVPVHVDGIPVKPFMGLGTWVAIHGSPEKAMLMGDTVLFEDEVNPAIDAAFAAGLSVTALHNHFFFDVPRVYFMHIAGKGDANQLAAGARQVWEAARQVRKDHPQPVQSFGKEVPQSGTLNTEALAQLLGTRGETQDGIFKVTLGRQSEMEGMPIGGSMGLTTWAAFLGSEQRAVVDGDFAMTGTEISPVLRTLRRAHINIVALHNHMVGEQPAIYFTHFWGVGKASELAQGLHQALEAQKQASPPPVP